MPRPRKVSEFNEPTVSIPLDDHQLAIKARELARIGAEVDKLRADAADHASTQRKKIRAKDKERRLLQECVNTGMEQQPAQLDLEKAGPVRIVGEKGSPSARSRGQSVDA